MTKCSGDQTSEVHPFSAFERTCNLFCKYLCPCTRDVMAITKMRFPGIEGEIAHTLLLLG
jgi:hypothetical protein